MAEFIDMQAREGDKSEEETNDEKEEETESDLAFIATENTPEKSKQMSELEKMDAKLEKSAKKKTKPKTKAKRKLSSSSGTDEKEEKIYFFGHCG